MDGARASSATTPDDAALVVDHFVDAEMRGAPGHGVERLRWLAGCPAPDGHVRLTSSIAATAWPATTRAAALGYLALAAALDPELAAPPGGARLVVVRTASPPAGWATSPTGPRGRGSSAC